VIAAEPSTVAGVASDGVASDGVAQTVWPRRCGLRRCGPDGVAQTAWPRRRGPDGKTHRTHRWVGLIARLLRLSLTCATAHDPARVTSHS